MPYIRDFKKLVNEVNTFGAKNYTEFLTMTGALGWGLSCAAQLVAIGINDKIPTKEKKFLIPHEIFDGVINITSFVLLTSRAQKIAQNLIINKKVLPHFMNDLKQHVIKQVDGKDYTKFDEFISTDFKQLTANTIKKTKVETEDYIAQMKNYLGKTDKNLANRFDTFQERFATVVSIGGSILSVNLATPIIRNQIAALFQKNSMKKGKVPGHEPANISATPIIKQPIVANKYYLQLARNHYNGIKI